MAVVGMQSKKLLSLVTVCGHQAVIAINCALVLALATFHADAALKRDEWNTAYIVLLKVRQANNSREQRSRFSHDGTYCKQ